MQRQAVAQAKKGQIIAPFFVFFKLRAACFVGYIRATFSMRPHLQHADIYLTKATSKEARKSSAFW